PLATGFPDSAFTGAALVVMQRAADRARLGEKAIRAGLQYLSGAGAGHEPLLVPVLQRSASLLAEAGRAEEAWGLVRRIQEVTGKSLYELDLNTQMLAIGCLSRIGQPDSALRLVEELRRGSGEQVLRSPRMRFLLGQACLSRGDLSGADTLLASLVSGGSTLEGEGVSRDSVLALLLELDRRRGRDSQFLGHALERLRLMNDPAAALALLGRMQAVAVSSGSGWNSLTQAVELFGRRFSATPQWAEARLIGAVAGAAAGDRRAALGALDDLQRGTTDSLLTARIGLAACALYLSLGDTLRAEAQLRDCLLPGADPLNVADSLLTVYAAICRGRGDFTRERDLLRRLCDSYPASRYWEGASQRLEELARFDLTDPALAAGELLDLFESGKGNVQPQRLAEIAGRRLGDYDRAASILRAAGSLSPSDRARLAEYLYLAALRARARGEGNAAEKMTQAWRELGRLLTENADFPGRETAVELYLNIYRSYAATFGASEVRAAEAFLRGELGRLKPGAPRTALLIWLGESCLAASGGEMTNLSMARSDSARAFLAQALAAGGSAEQAGRACLDLARALESAGFAGALDSAAHLYGALTDRASGSRWSALAGLRLASIHLEQERFSVAYAAARAWADRHPYAADSPQSRAVLAEAAYHTGRNALAAVLFGRMERDSLPREDRMRFDCYRIRALAGMGEYASACALLVRYMGASASPEERQAGCVAAVDLFLEAGDSRQALQYLAQLPEQGDYYALARVRWLIWSLSQGTDPEKVRKELERYRKAAWNPFYKVDPALLASRGIMQAYMAQNKPDKVSETRNDFRRNFPESRGGLAEMMLDEIEYLLTAGLTDQAASLNDDLRMLFGDVWPEDRAVWVSACLARAQGNTSAYSAALERLARDFNWSPWAVEAKRRMIELYVSAGQVDKARGLLASLPPESASETQLAGMRGQILGGAGDWTAAQSQFAARWAALPPSSESGQAVLDWAGAELKAGRKAAAREMLSALWSGSPETVAEARFLLVSLYRSDKQDAAALEAMDGLGEAYPERTEIVLKAMYQKGLIQEGLGQREAAVATYRQLETLATDRSDWVRSARERLRALSGAAQP
ncbi:tetratricopeptide repeat protein, partial [bacterium]|nr:tetratricopeptide repeat protein [bacterium]